MSDQTTIHISGKENGSRIESRVLEEQIQTAVADGYRRIKIEALGQHGIGGRLFKAGDDPVTIRISGHPGQRVGAMGFPNTKIEILGPASDDVGWLNAGAHITIHGNAGNGAANAMAQGKICIEGNIGARGMTMTKHNPRFDPPELWVLGGTGDYFGEFMAGGVAVICGFESQNPDNILGYRPLVGMVGGKVFFRGPHEGYSQVDAKQIPIDDDTYAWLHENLKVFLGEIGRGELMTTLAEREKWQLIRARTPMEKKGRPMRAMTDFRNKVWNRELGAGGLVGDLTDIDRRAIPLVPTGELRRYVPVWENRQYAAPCEATCPSGIPVQERWRLIREGRVDEAVDLALAYTPFPATVCGYLCPSPCMTACTKQTALIEPVDVTLLGKASINAGQPELPPTGDTRVGVIGGGPAGISVAWQLRLKGHDVVVYDTASKLGGKISSAIPNLRIPEEIVDKELARIRGVIPHVQMELPSMRKPLPESANPSHTWQRAPGARPRFSIPG
jgi:glutamate synthase domain-containing protein 3